MKKLLDDTTDELARSLLRAGAEQRPPQGSRAKLLVALGAGSTLGLFGSKALAWLGTSAGKLTVVSVGVCAVGGAMYAVAPRSAEQRAAMASVRPATVVAAPQASLPAQPALSAELAASEGLDRAGPRVAAPASSRATASSRVQRVATSSAPRRKLNARAPDTALATSEQAGLDSEVKLVDELRAAVEAGDWLSARQRLASYSARFPHGQLMEEVGELAQRMPATPY